MELATVLVSTLYASFHAEYLRINREAVPLEYELMCIELRVIKNSDAGLRAAMSIHYSKPNGFVGRNICYAVYFDGICYGHIVAGSTPLHLPRSESMRAIPLNSIANNIFYHIEKIDGMYPQRNFTSKVLEAFVSRVALDWFEKYGDRVRAFESLVELPRTGECYRRCGWVEVGMTKGQTCKRIAGRGTDKWSGKRVWDTKNLRPKRVFALLLQNPSGTA